jgi:heme A synthase
VPTPLAVTHQAGSVSLLTMALWYLHELRDAAHRFRLKPKL